MNDIEINPRILWKVDLSFVYSVSRSYSQNVHILKSYWKLTIEFDKEWEEYKIYILPENPKIYLNVRFIVQCGVRDTRGICRLERIQTLTIDNLFDNFIWGAGRNLLLEENLIQNNVLCVLCSIEPESKCNICLFLTDPTMAENYCTSITPCTDDLIGDLRYLFEHNLHHDIILECENEIIKAHKSILSCRSDVFKGMFRNNTKEALEGKVVIRDTPFHILEKIIRYIYTTEIKLEDVSDACSIYTEADKFLIISLKERCCNFFKAYLCFSCSKSELSGKVIDACKVLYLADKHADNHLRCWIEDYLADSRLLVTPEWINFADNNPEAAMKIYFKLLKKVKFNVSKM